MFSWIAKGFENIGNFLKTLIGGIGDIVNYLNPLSDKFFLKDFFEFIGESLSYINPFSENFIFKDFFANFIDWFNPFSENFILKKLWTFLTDIVSYINPFDDNFLGKKIIELLGDLLKDLFVPSEERIKGLQNSVMSKFDFVESIKISINSFKDIINNLGNAPVLHLDLESTKYTNKMTINVIDLNWYKPYKKYGDVVITGLFYAFYLWRIFSKLPGIISGAGSGACDMINISNFQAGGGKK